MNSRLALRCLYLIEYTGNAEDSIGYHQDGDTFLTTNIILSEPAEYRGGRFEMRRTGCVETYGGLGPDGKDTALKRGDVLGWRGWDDHRVTPVLGGKRRVVVAEWRCCSATDDAKDPHSRPSNTLDGLRHALNRDPESANIVSTPPLLLLLRMCSSASMQ